MITPEVAAWSIWGATILVVVMSLGFLKDTYAERRDARWEWKRARLIGNGRVPIAEYSLKSSFAFLAGAVASLALGLVAAWALLFLPPAPPDTRLSSAILRVLFIVIIALFWRTLRLKRALRERLEDEPSPMETRMDRLEAKQNRAEFKQDDDLRISKETRDGVKRMEKRMEGNG
ncbi:MAG: hypothetical protein M3R38_02985 [Actinomycetota bacterium]|nr:hypothetical protein [Actinomycetota bacterium]